MWITDKIDKIELFDTPYLSTVGQSVNTLWDSWSGQWSGLIHFITMCMRWFIWLCPRVHDDDNYSIWVLLTKLKLFGTYLAQEGHCYIKCLITIVFQICIVFHHNSFFLQIQNSVNHFFFISRTLYIGPKDPSNAMEQFFVIILWSPSNLPMIYLRGVVNQTDILRSGWS